MTVVLPGDPVDLVDLVDPVVQVDPVDLVDLVVLVDPVDRSVMKRYVLISALFIVASRKRYAALGDLAV